MMKEYKIIGLMSGTSLDGLDICYVKFDISKTETKFDIIETETIPYNNEWKDILQNSINLNSESLLKLNSDYGFYLGEKVNEFINKYNINSIDCISSHGHTIFHNPKNKYTLQIGNGSAISSITKQKVICDFRSQDVILGGQGAPLVPIGDELLFGNFDACLNLGGFSNISFRKNDKRIAFDICPVNIVLNKLAKKDNLDFDIDGNLAKTGNIIPELLKELNYLEYYQKKAPKSLGIEWCFKNIFPLTDKYENDFSNKDSLATLTEHFSEQISIIITNNNLKNILFTGGGTNNKFLIDLIKSKTSTEIVIPNNKLIDFKEALIFAFLGMLKLENQNNILSSVTGASKDHCSGIIYEI